VWAWRRWRIRKIRRAVDHMLTLFPFEARYYRGHGVPVTFVGHPLADQLDDKLAQHELRRRLGLAVDATVIALLPGSRLNELQRHAELFVRTAQWLYARHPGIRFIAPFVDVETRAVFELAIERLGAGHLPVRCVLGRSREAMAAADIVVLASGTAALEAALLRKVMIVTYRVSWLSALLAWLFVRVRYYSLPNHLAGRRLVPEFMQGRATPENLGRAVEYYLSHPRQALSMRNALARMRRALCCHADRRAADAVWRLLKRRRPATAPG
jgi:lipid-A-disaccharide synthase